jgi:hypothetical protein
MALSFSLMLRQKSSCLTCYLVDNLPKSGSEVELLAAMMNLMNSPQEPNLMAGTVEAIISKV